MNKRTKKKYKLTEKELKNAGVSKLLFNVNGDLQDKITKLEDSLIIQQNAFEGLREKHNELEKENHVLKERLKFNLLPEILKFIFIIGIGYLTNLLTSKYNDNLVLLILLFVILYVIIMIYQYFNNK